MMRSNTRGTRRGASRRTTQLMVALLLICVIPNVSLGYSVLSHEAIIDSMWVEDITPVLLKKFPGASEDELREAHGYAYGGSIIQDMGYYPFGSRFYSDLTHYARSGEFIEALLRDAQDVKEYAFAIGALSHYCTDTDGHPIATNLAVGILYPKLRRKFGDTVTYAKSASAHMQTEFGFDVLQVAQGHFASRAYHDFIGFKVAKSLLERAFKETYGIELTSLFTSLDLALGTYRHSVAFLIPKLTKVAWESSKAEMAKRGVAQQSTLASDSAAVGSQKPAVALTRDKFLFNISRSEYNKEWGAQYRQPGFFSKVLAFLFRFVPKIGPFASYNIKTSTPETELLFMRSFDAATVSFRKSLVTLGADNFALVNKDLDTGKPTSRGEYTLGDGAYAKMLHILRGKKFQDVTPELRADINAFYRDTTMRRGTKKDTIAWRQTLGDLKGMRDAELAPPPAGKQ